MMATTTRALVLGMAGAGAWAGCVCNAVRGMVHADDHSNSVLHWTRTVARYAISGTLVGAAVGATAPVTVPLLVMSPDWMVNNEKKQHQSE